MPRATPASDSVVVRSLLAAGPRPAYTMRPREGLVVDRRTFLSTLAGSLLAAPLVAEAQSAGKVPVVGILNSTFTGQSTAIAAFRSGLLDAGFIEGQTIALEIRSAGGKPEALVALAAGSNERSISSLPSGQRR